MSRQFRETARDPRGRAALASVATASSLCLLKLAAVVVADSAAVLAALVDSAADLAASLVTFVSVHHALQPPDRAHRYGHGKAEALSALVQAAFIVGSGGVVLLDAARRVLAPRPVEQPMIGVAVMVVAMLATLALVTYQRRVIRRTGSTAIAADRMHYVSDFATNGSVLVALLLIHWTGIQLFDQICAAAIALWLVWNGVRVGRGAVDMLMDRELPVSYRRRVTDIVHTHPEAHGIHDLRTRRSGTDEFVEFHLELDGRLTLRQAHDITHAIEDEIRAALPNAIVTVHQEPAGLSDERLDDVIHGPI